MPDPLRKAFIPKPVLLRINRFDLPRSVLVKLLTCILSLLPAAYPDIRNRRVVKKSTEGQTLDLCRFEAPLREKNISHLFLMLVDDKTDPSKLFVREISYVMSEIDEK